MDITKIGQNAYIVKNNSIIKIWITSITHKVRLNSGSDRAGKYIEEITYEDNYNTKYSPPYEGVKIFWNIEDAVKELDGRRELK